MTEMSVNNNKQQQSIMTPFINEKSILVIDQAANLINTNNAIEHCEEIGRQKFYKNITKFIKGAKNIIFTPTAFRHDAEVEGDNGKFAVEIKVRNCAHDKHLTNLIKTNKLRAMRALSAKGFIPLYANFYNDGFVRIWNLNNLTELRQEDVMVKITQMNAYSASELQSYHHVSMCDSKTFNLNI